MKKLFSFLLALVALLSPTYGQSNNKPETIKRIENYLFELDKIGLTGSLLVELDGEKVISTGYGFSNREQMIKNSPATIFDIGSITKQFTAAAILKLEMQGKLSTDDLISKYFKNVPVDKERTTIHDLLRHQAGLPGGVGGDYEKISREEFLEKTFAAPLRFETGTSFGYSNVGYSLLAMIVEQVSGKSYETYLYENLWKPAGMEMTGYSRPKFDNNLIAIGYTREDSLWGRPTDKEWDGPAPFWHLKGNGGILSTTEDLYKWHQALMSDKILSKEAKQKYYHPKIRANENAESIYAYGWDVSKTTRGTTRVWHNGSNRIFYADFVRYIDEGITMIMMTNKFHPNYNDLNNEISRIIFYPSYSPEIPMEDNAANREFTAQIIQVIKDSGLEKAKEVYLNRAQHLSLLEYKMRNEGFANLDDSKPEVAMLIFEMNDFANPNSAKALQGLGEGYMETKQKEQALIYFKKSLALKPDNRFVEDMIIKLED